MACGSISEEGVGFQVMQIMVMDILLAWALVYPVVNFFLQLIEEERGFKIPLTIDKSTRVLIWWSQIA